MINDFYPKETGIRHTEFPVRSYATEWDWGAEIPFINEKFGTRTRLNPLDPMGKGWWSWPDSLVEKTVMENPVMYLHYGSLDSQIKQLYTACEKTGAPRLIITDEKIRSKHKVPSNVRILVTHAMAYQYSKIFDESKLRPVYKRKVDNLEHSFMIMASNPDSPATYVLMVLQELGALENALYSSPSLPAEKWIREDDKLAINHVIKDLKKNYIGGDYVRFDHKKNLNIISENLKKCHFFVAIDRDVFYNDYVHWSIAEKHLQCFTSTTPVMPIWTDAESTQMKEWGFRFENIVSRQQDETVQCAVKRWCEKILFNLNITKNQQWSQAWQDTNAPDTTHNFELLKKLHQNIANEIDQQIDELPKEFKNL